MNPKSILTIVKKELYAYFNSPTAYIVLVVFLLLWEFLFFRNALIIGEASLRLLLSYLPWLFLILIPALTMGSISQEKSEGTLELLLTHPINALELILGKFLASVFFIGLALLFIFPIAYSFDRFGSLDWGVVGGQYLASLMLASVLVALGLFISSLFASPIAALLVSATASFFIIIAGFEIITLSLPASLSVFVERLSALSHFESMSRGVIDLRDIWYFFSVTAIFLSLAYLQLLKFRVGNQRQVYRQYLTAITLFIAIAVMVNVVGARIPGRLDLTQDKMYQLTDTTRDTVQQLDDVVNIQLYATQELPSQLRPILRDIKDTLKDYQTIGNGKIKYSVIDPRQDNQAQNQANSLGIREVQFNVIGQEELQLKKGYLGIALAYGGNTEVLPFVTDTSDLEYQLTSSILKLTKSDKKSIAFLAGHGEKLPFSDYGSLTSEIEKLYTVTEFTFPEEGDPVIPPEYDTLVVAGPTEPITDGQKAAIKTYLDNGGSLLVLVDNVIVNDAILSATLNQSSFADFLNPLGVGVNYDIIYDLRSSETINFSAGNGVSYVLQYPFWPRALLSDTSSPIANGIDTLVFPWPSSISLNQQQLQNQGFEVKQLFTTSQFAGTQTSNFNLAPDQQLVPNDLEQRLLAVSLLKENPGSGTASRLVVVSDSDFLTERFAGANGENFAFGLSSIAWLSQEESLAKIQLKQRTARPILFTDSTQPQLVKYGNLFLAFLLPFTLGITRLLRRRSLHKLRYTAHL